jgi:ribosomal 30S subunit maturation factor RimM
VSELLRMQVVDAQGNTLGNVKQVLVNKTDNMGWVVIGGGSLGDKQVAVPVRGMVLQNGNLVAHDLTEEKVRAMPAWTAGDLNFAGVKNDQTVVVSTAA